MEVQYASVWERNSDVIPDKIALICGNNEVTWKEYDDRAARLASLLSEAGLGDDSKVGLYSVSYTHLTLPTNREV